MLSSSCSYSPAGFVGTDTFPKYCLFCDAHAPTKMHLTSDPAQQDGRPASGLAWGTHVGNPRRRETRERPHWWNGRAEEQSPRLLVLKSDGRAKVNNVSIWTHIMGSQVEDTLVSYLNKEAGREEAMFEAEHKVCDWRTQRCKGIWGQIKRTGMEKVVPSMEHFSANF